MNTTFKKIEDAIRAGFRRVDRGTDKDVSGRHSYGYEFEDEEGHRTVTVWFTEEKNQIGAFGCVIPMFPPKEVMK